MTNPEPQPSSQPVPGETSPACARTAPDADQLIDLRVRLRWWNRPPWRSVRLGLTPWVILLGGLPVLKWLGSTHGVRGMVLGGIVGAGGVWLAVFVNGAIQYFEAHRAVNRILETGIEAPGHSIRDNLAHECRPMHVTRLLLTLRQLADSLCESGRGGLAVRCSSKTQPPPDPIAPVKVPFEPVPLDDSEPAFQGVAEAGGSAAREVKIDERAAIAPRRVTRPWRRESGWPGLLSIRTFMTLGFILVLFVQFTHGLSSWWLILITFVTGPLALGLSFLKPGPARMAWVFPGGIAVPTPWQAKRWRIVRRVEGILIVPPISGTLTVVTRAETHALKCSAAEAELALRAWFSPIPPPTDEQLGEFFA